MNYFEFHKIKDFINTTLFIKIFYLIKFDLFYICFYLISSALPEYQYDHNGEWTLCCTLPGVLLLLVVLIRPVIPKIYICNIVSNSKQCCFQRILVCWHWPVRDQGIFKLEPLHKDGVKQIFILRISPTIVRKSQNLIGIFLLYIWTMDMSI